MTDEITKEQLAEFILECLNKDEDGYVNRRDHCFPGTANPLTDVCIDIEFCDVGQLSQDIMEFLCKKKK